MAQVPDRGNVSGAASDDGARLLTSIAFAEIEGWGEDDHAAAFACFIRSSASILEHTPHTRTLGLAGEGLIEPARRALALGGGASSDDARAFFERHFSPLLIGAEGFVTGYFEPELDASRTPDARFSVPLYARPDDLVEIGEDAPPGWDPAIRFARRGTAGPEPHFDRASIEAGALAGRGLEIAYVEDPVDAFYVHVQGSARLRLVDGSTMRVGFAAKSGHPYTSIGRLAVERGLLPRERADKDGLEAWLKGNRAAGVALMRENRSFIFFRELGGLGDADGPLGAAGVPLTAGRSLAVDRTLMTFHMPVFVTAPTLPDLADPDRPFRRLMVAQDTGSAILGPARGDIFVGSGFAAGSLAGRIRHEVRMVVLVPREMASPS
jgi:membrane-bound lytic murein transglycosylase A